MRRLGGAVSLALALLLVATPALAITPPTSTVLDEVTVWRHFLELNDLLILARYTITFASPPSESVDLTFMGRFMNGDTEFASVAPYPYYLDKGYGQGVFAIYLSATQVTAKSITWETTSYSVRLSGNPALAWDPSFPSVSSSALSWQTYSSKADTASALATKLLAIAGNLSIIWNIDLTTPTTLGTKFSTSGEDYFTRAIPDLRTATPNIFQIAFSTPTFREETHAKTYETTLKEQVGWVNSALDSVAADFSIGRGMIGVFIALATVIAVIILGLRFGIGAEMGLVASIAPLVGEAKLGLLSLTALGIMSLLCILLAAFILFLKKAT